jgi:RNase adaptor protein for sRNA GlmZ degradation
MADLPQTTTLIANPEPRLTATGAPVANHPSALITSVGYLHGPGPDS